MGRDLDRCQMVERSILKKYRKRLWKPFVYAVQRYELIQAGDRIAVCVSGGKDSILLAKLMQELHRHSDRPFDLSFLVMDPGYSAADRRKVEDLARDLRVPVTVFETDIFPALDGVGKSPCYLCARMRRGHLYSRARDLGCNKIALGHHFDDVVETTVLGMFYGSQLQAMMPKLHSRDFPGMELIRPLYCVHEEDIRAWIRYNGLDPLRGACPVTAGRSCGGGKRQEVKDLLRRLEETAPDIRKSIFSSIHNVSLDMFPGYKKDGIRRSFLDEYDARRPGRVPDER